MSAALVQVGFYGDTLDAVQDGRDVYLVLRRACENIGLSTQGQLEKLRSKEWATIKMIFTVAEDGKTRESAALHLDSVPMWLATLDAKRAKADARPKLVAYQRECARVLKEHFVPPVPAANDIDLRAFAREVATETATATASAVIGALAKDFFPALVLSIREGLDDKRALDASVAGDRGRRWILSGLRHYGEIMGGDSKSLQRSWRSRGETELRGHLGFSGAARAWHDLPMADYARARIKLTEMLKMAERIGTGPRRQMPLAPQPQG